MKLLGFVILGLLAGFFVLHGLDPAQTAPISHGAVVETAAVADDAVTGRAVQTLAGAQRAALGYVVNTPGDLARLKAENDAALVRMCAIKDPAFAREVREYCQ